MTIKIGNIESVRGERTTGSWMINRDADLEGIGFSLDIHSGNDGEMRIFIATGPEYPSILAESVLLRIGDLIKSTRLNGTLILAPDFARTLNKLSGSDKPLYPGWPRGDFGEKIAFEIFNDLLTKVDYAIFLEGTDPAMRQLPHAALYSVDNPPLMSCHPELLKMMGHDLIMEKEALDGSLVIEAQRQLALPVLVSQVDEIVDSDDTRKWLEERIMNFLAYVGLIDLKPIIPDRTFIATRDAEIRSNADGDAQFHSQLGDFLSEGDKVGVVHGEKPDEKTEIENNSSGYIVGRRHEGKIARDDVVCSMLSVGYVDESMDQIFCQTALDNTEMDVNFRPNKLFHGLTNKRE